MNAATTILFYDFETSDMVQFKEPSDHPSQPHITQICAELCIEETGESLAFMDCLIRPEGWEITPFCQELNGITMERANRFGVPIYDAMNVFIELWTNADLRAAHNESFDARMARIELKRHAHYSTEKMLTADGEVPFADYWKSAPAFCTMAKSTSIVCAPRADGKKGFKFPKLTEAYKFFTGTEMEGAHNARHDVSGLKVVYYAIKAYNASQAEA